MKKNLFLFLLSFFFILFSCEKDDFVENSIETQKNTVSVTRAVNVPSPLDQLAGIPVNIRNAASKKYLSTASKGDKVDLYTKDDGSLRQRWYVSHDAITLVGGNRDYPGGVIACLSFTSNRPLLMPPSPLLMLPSLARTQDPSSYRIEYISFDFKMYGLQPENENSNTLIFSPNGLDQRIAMWEVYPIDEFRIVNITYDLTTDDKLVVIPKLLSSRNLDNDTDVPATRTFSFQETISSESSFAKTEGLNVNSSTSVKFGLPGFKEGGFDFGVSTGKNWSYTVGQKEIQTFTVSETITQEIPARTSIIAEFVATEYQASLTYIAQMVGVNTGKTIYLKGRWDGVVVQESKIRLYYPNGQLMKSISVNPK